MNGEIVTFIHTEDVNPTEIQMNLILSAVTRGDYFEEVGENTFPWFVDNYELSVEMSNVLTEADIIIDLDGELMKTFTDNILPYKLNRFLRNTPVAVVFLRDNDSDYTDAEKDILNYLIKNQLSYREYNIANQSPKKLYSYLTEDEEFLRSLRDN